MYVLSDTFTSIFFRKQLVIKPAGPAVKLEVPLEITIGTIPFEDIYGIWTRNGILNDGRINGLSIGMWIANPTVLQSAIVCQSEDSSSYSSSCLAIEAEFSTSLHFALICIGAVLV